MDSPCRVHKFGGTSVATADRVAHAALLVRLDVEAHPDGRTVVVTSALGGVTDDLLQAIREAEERSGVHRQVLADLRQRHRDVAQAVARADEVDGLLATIDGVVAETDELLHGIYLLRQCTPRFSDAVLSAGERLAAPLLAAAIRKAGSRAVDLDARDLVITDDAFGEAAVQFDRTTARVRSVFGKLPPHSIIVVTGFIAATPDGVTTTLGRSGSDYTATLLGGALGAETVVIWTDVDGVLSTDPHLVPEAYTLSRLTYREAAELAHFGARVLHPRTMRPLERAGIPLRIRNTLRPGSEGTLIKAESVPGAQPIKAVTAVRDVALVTLEGAGILGVADMAARAFATISSRGIQVLLVAQASSEGSLCLAIRGRDAASAESALNAAFARETERGDLRGIQVDQGHGIVAAVGRGMRRHAGLAGKMFATLARAHVNVHAIAEGASDHNLSCVVLDEDAARAVNALHEAFALNRLRAHVVVLGVGTIGSRLLALIERQSQPLREQGINLRLVGLGNSRGLVWGDDGVDPEEATSRLRGLSETADDVPARLVEQLRRARLERLIVVDATPSHAVPAHYPEWIAAGAAVVSPNQRALTRDDGLPARIREAARTAEVPFIYDTTVGGGLSVLSTLRDLVRTGDRIIRIDGAFSTTLVFVFEAMRKGRAFSEAVREAAERGLTEPDPRSDLAGNDVARKLLILAAEAGRPMARDGVAVESLVPPALESVSLDEFWRRLPEADAHWADRQSGLASRGRQIQYTASLAADGVRAGVQELPGDSPLARLTDGAVLFAFHTERYSPNALVVTGPGASADVTAAVLLADVVRAAEMMR